MTNRLPPFPEGQPPLFRSTVHGTVFAGRDRYVDGLTDGDEVRLVADPPVQDDSEVWVHLTSGEPIGHLGVLCLGPLQPRDQHGTVVEHQQIHATGRCPVRKAIDIPGGRGRMPGTGCKLAPWSW